MPETQRFLPSTLPATFVGFFHQLVQRTRPTLRSLQQVWGRCRTGRDGWMKLHMSMSWEREGMCGMINEGACLQSKCKMLLQFSLLISFDCCRLTCSSPRRRRCCCCCCACRGPRMTFYCWYDHSTNGHHRQPPLLKLRSGFCPLRHERWRKAGHEGTLEALRQAGSISSRFCQVAATSNKNGDVCFWFILIKCGWLTMLN